MTLQPDPGRSLADGLVVQAHLRARLFGLPLLSVRGVVLVAPAGLAGAEHPVVLDGDGDLAQVRRTLRDNRERLRQLR